MPWTNQSGGGGGGWQGGGNRGPWSQGPSGGGGGNQPPDLEELLKRSQDRFRNLFPPGFGGNWVVLAVLALALLWAASGFYTVSEGEQGVETRFGAFSQTTATGLHFHWPYPVENVRTVRIALQRSVEIGDVPAESLMLTGDENIVDIAFNVIWDIKSAPDYLFNVRDPEGTVKAVAESAMREVVGRSRIELLQTEERNSTAEAAKALIQATLDSYGAGIFVNEVNMQRVVPPDPVIDAFQDVQSAKADLNSAINTATAYRNKVVPEAHGEAESIRQAASAYKEQAVAQAQGDAQRFLAVLAEYKLAKDVTRKRIYLETMERILGRSNKVLLDGKSASQVLPYQPLDRLGKARAGESAPLSGGDQP
jgi:membrane protease subunit HflK